MSKTTMSPSLTAALLVEEPLKDGERLVVAQRQDDVGGHVIGVDIHHEVGEYPVV